MSHSSTSHPAALPDPDRSQDGRFAILTVCSGNICRSPLAEQLLRAGLSDVADVSVSSSGTIAMVGHAMTSEAQRLAAAYGAPDAGAHVARALTAQQIVEADLVLALSREHRRAIVALVPSAMRRTFTLREFARLAAAVPDGDLEHGRGRRQLASAIAVVASFRGRVEAPDAPADDDVIDPYRRSRAVYRQSAEQLVPAVRATVAFVDRVVSPR